MFPKIKEKELKPRIIAMIPARRGSERLKAKNLAILNGKPLLFYAIEAAKASGVFDRTVVNSEDEIFAGLAKRFGAEFYHRPPALGSSQAKSDDVIKDFMSKNPCDYLAWVNPTSPLQTGNEIKAVADFFIQEKCDSLVTVKSEQVHTLFKHRPLNFNEDEMFAKTQDLEPVLYFVYSVMMWRTQAFLEQYKRKGFALLCGKVGYYAVSKLSSVIIKTEDDLRLAEYILTGMEARRNYQVQYEKKI